MKVSSTQLRAIIGIAALGAIALPAHAGFFGPFNPVPEPSVLALMGIGLGTILLINNRNKRK